ncbi:MAG: beta-lactamase family protein [Bacteroidales bacterium]|nr:beta-lactamase family protein [Candidatus Cacconaster merdequi]
MKKTFILSAILAVVLVAGCKDPQEKAFEKEIGAYLDSVQNVGLSCVLVKDNKIVYNHNFGVKDLETKEPIDDQTIFRIASISKSFTCTSLLQLVDKGVLSLKDNVSDLVGFPVVNPNFPEDTITLEMLLSHTSSLTDREGYYTLDVIDPATNPNSANCYSDKKPGSTYRYCNLNLNLSGTILERYSGERFDQYVVNHVLKPMGLYGGYCVDSLDASRFAQLYDIDENGELVRQDEAYEPRSEKIANYIQGRDTPVFSPTGGMKISAIDLAKYMMMHMNYGACPFMEGVRIIPEELSKDMQCPRSEYTHENYCLTLWWDDSFTPDVELVGHTGGAYGLSSAMFFNPEEKYGFVVINSGAKADGVHRHIVSRMYDYFIKGEK